MQVEVRYAVPFPACGSSEQYPDSLGMNVVEFKNKTHSLIFLVLDDVEGGNPNSIVDDVNKMLCVSKCLESPTFQMRQSFNGVIFQGIIAGC